MYIEFNDRPVLTEILVVFYAIMAARKREARFLLLNSATWGELLPLLPAEYLTYDTHNKAVMIFGMTFLIDDTIANNRVRIL